MIGSRSMSGCDGRYDCNREGEQDMLRKIGIVLAVIVLGTASVQTTAFARGGGGRRRPFRWRRLWWRGPRRWFRWWRPLRRRRLCRSRFRRRRVCRPRLRRWVHKPQCWRPLCRARHCPRPSLRPAIRLWRRRGLVLQPMALRLLQLRRRQLLLARTPGRRDARRRHRGPDHPQARTDRRKMRQVPRIRALSCCHRLGVGAGQPAMDVCG